MKPNPEVWFNCSGETQGSKGPDQGLRRGSTPQIKILLLREVYGKKIESLYMQRIKKDKWRTHEEGGRQTEGSEFLSQALPKA